MENGADAKQNIKADDIDAGGKDNSHKTIKKRQSYFEKYKDVVVFVLFNFYFFIFFYFIFFKKN